MLSRSANLLDCLPYGQTPHGNCRRQKDWLYRREGVGGPTDGGRAVGTRATRRPRPMDLAPKGYLTMLAIFAELNALADQWDHEADHGSVLSGAATRARGDAAQLRATILAIEHRLLEQVHRDVNGDPAAPDAYTGDRP